MMADLDDDLACINCGYVQGGPAASTADYWDRMRVIKPHEGKGRRVGGAERYRKRESA